MTSDSTPAFEIEKEALKTEIETGIQSGVDHLEAKTAKRKDADKYHNTRHLLKQYRKVAYAIQISEADMNVRMEMEHGTRLSTLEVNAELAGVDLSGSKLEGYARTVIRSKNMLQIIDNALNTVRMDPDHGELMYQVLYLTYFSKKKPANREVILAELDRQGFPMSMVTYHSYVEAGKCAQIEWENSAVTGQIQIRKYSADDNRVTGQRAGSALEGAVFEITQARSGKVVGYIVTDARGVAASDPLPLGRYFVTEVSAPKYYQLSSEKMEAEIEYPNQIIKLSAYNKSANLGVTIKKTGNHEVQPGQVMSYDFSGIGNISNVALNSFFWHDRIPTDATRAISVTTGTYNARLYYKVSFKTNLSDYRTLASNLLTSNNYSLSLNAATLGLAQGEYVTDVRFEFGTVPSGFASVVKPTMRVQVLGTVSNGYQIINRADVGGQYLNEWQTAKATWVTTVCRFNNNPLPKTGY